MANDAIGIFDSGLGGLTTVKELNRILPMEDIIYFGDTGRVPYGTRSKDAIIKYAKQDIAFLKSFKVKMIIAACGTVSSVANFIGDSLPLPFIGIVKPCAIAAVKATKNGKIGVIGTAATIKSHAYLKEMNILKENLDIFEIACPLFVPLIESGIISPGDPVLLEVARRYLLELKEKNIDTLILGCTHYPIIMEAISSIMGENVNIINSGRETAIYAYEFLKNRGMLKKSDDHGKYLFYVSDTADGFESEASKFLNLNLEYKCKKIDIEQY
ncbi:MAG: glutamate racemase [Oscillospiraceae bacterium]|jgi:glutamate racemase|nr:glutamate racemase [Oscillospiraceae bacterium]